MGYRINGTQRPWKSVSILMNSDLKLVYDGNEVDGWQNLRWPHDILAALDWLADSVLIYGLQLKAGDLVLTSAWGTPIPVNDVQRVDVSSSTFGDVHAKIAG